MEHLLPEKMETLEKTIELKRIFSVIESSMKGSKSPCIVVTSGEQGEGKTTLCAGLALSAAIHNGHRVLAVDYNWYSPALHDYFDLDLLEDIESFNGAKPIKELVRHTSYDNLDILPAVHAFEGNGNGQTGTSDRHLDLLQRSREEYDYIFVDTPSTFPTNYRMMDPVLISKAADGVVLVALTNVTPRQTLKRATMTMETSGAKLIGVVANQWKNPIA